MPSPAEPTTSEALPSKTKARAAQTKAVTVPNTVLSKNKGRSSSSGRSKRECAEPPLNTVKKETPLVYRPLTTPSAISASGPSMSDLDSDSDELSLPAVNEAIRMLDLDSQGHVDSRSSSVTTPSAFHQPLKSAAITGSTGLLRMLPSLNNSLPGVQHQQHTWPSVGYCSSLLQQFVAKSQSGEPPPPPPATNTLMLPTKGARKCFSMNEMENQSSAASSKRANDSVVRPSFVPAIPAVALASSHGHSSAHEQELEMLVPMRGLDCHSSHVSPDSGIQSVSGSPFSVHSSPVHPSGASSGGFSSGQQLQGGSGTQQQQTMHHTTTTYSPCPPAPSPSPPLPSKKQSKKTGSKSSRKGGNSEKSNIRPDPEPVITVPSNSRRNPNRRPRSCRDTASALSSGMNKDNSIVQVLKNLSPQYLIQVINNFVFILGYSERNGCSS